MVLVYNGHPNVLGGAVSSTLVRYGGTPSNVTSIGYTDGATGTLDELLLHFGLDGESVYKTALAAIAR